MRKLKKLNKFLLKGQEVSYDTLHKYIKQNLEKPIYCQFCRQVKKLDLANKSGNYLEDLSDWLYLCRKCHVRQDNRLIIYLNTKLTLAQVAFIRKEYKPRIISQRKLAKMFNVSKTAISDIVNNRTWNYL